MRYKRPNSPLSRVETLAQTLGGIPILGLALTGE